MSRRVTCLKVLVIGFLIAGCTTASAATPTITTLAGTGGVWGFSGDGGSATQAQLWMPQAVAVLPSGGFLIADRENHRVRKVDAAGQIATVAGTGSKGFSNDGGPATQAQLASPTSVAALADGGFLIADSGNHRIRKVDSSGQITTVAGTGVKGLSGDGGLATQAQLAGPHTVDVLPSGAFLIADPDNNRIRKVDSSGVITTVAGNGSGGFSGDGGSATQAQLNSPKGVTALADGGFLIADFYNHRIRKVDAGGVITTVAGAGTNGFSGDGGQAIQAQLAWPISIAAMPWGGFLIVDFHNFRVRKVDADGVIKTVAGTGTWGFAGDGGAATQAQLGGPAGIALMPGGGFLVSSGDQTVRRVSADPVEQLRCAGHAEAERIKAKAARVEAARVEGVKRKAETAGRIAESAKRKAATRKDVRLAKQELAEIDDELSQIERERTAVLSDERDAEAEMDAAFAETRRTRGAERDNAQRELATARKAADRARRDLDRIEKDLQSAKKDERETREELSQASIVPLDQWISEREDRARSRRGRLEARQGREIARQSAEDLRAAGAADRQETRQLREQQARVGEEEPQEERAPKKRATKKKAAKKKAAKRKKAA